MTYINAAATTDFYKTGHRTQYPENTEYVYSNFTARSAKYASMLPDWDNKVVFFGIQAMIQKYLIDRWNEDFFCVDANDAINSYKKLVDKALGEGAVPVDHIARLWQFGYLPIEIKALPEGSRVNIGIPLFTITNTNKDFAWLVNYLETPISNEIWPMITAATIAYEYKRLLIQYAKITGTTEEFVLWQGHDFSMRGLMGVDAATTLVGPAHLTSFLGTDTVPAIPYVESMYDAENEFIGGSVPATEHSVASANIMFIERELERKGEWNGFKVEDL